MKKLFATLLISMTFLYLHAQDVQGILSKTETDSLVTRYCRELNKTYFNRALGKEITATLQSKLAAGDFYNVTQLTDRLSLLLRDITKDIHFLHRQPCPRACGYGARTGGSTRNRR